MADLDRLIARARAASLRPEVITTGVASARAAAQPRPRTASRWLRAVLAAIGVATLGVAWAGGLLPVKREAVERAAPAALSVPGHVTAPPLAATTHAAPPAPPSPPSAPPPSPPPHLPPPSTPMATHHDPGVASTSAVAAAPLDLDARWREERHRRAAGDLAGAVAACEDIARAGDPTWTPIAELEAARIELGPLGHVEAARELAQRVLDDWPTSALAREAGELRCRALTQLGRPCR